MSKKEMLFFVLVFTTNFIFSQSVDSIMLDTTLTDAELSFQDSIAELNKQNQIFSNSRKAYNSGLDLFNDKNFAEAIIKFTNAVVIDSSFSQAYFYRAKCYESSNHDLAISDYQISFSLDSTNLTPLYSMAKIQSIYDINTAINTYNFIISTNNQESKAYYEIGVLFYLQKNIEKAITSFTKSILLQLGIR